MEILKDNIIKCSCGTTFAYEENDIEKGYVSCPCCNKKYKVGFSYPEDFDSFKNGKNIPNSEINSYIQKGLDFLKRNKESDYWLFATGNMIIFIVRNDDDEEFSVTVSKDYSEGYVEY